jgi:signal transduction histidine kinase
MTKARLRFAVLALGGALLGIALVLKPLGDAGTTSGAYASPWLALLIGWGFIGTGLLAWHRRPGNRIGALMTAVGFAWCLRFLSSSTYALPQTIGLISGALWAGLLIHMILAFPWGRLQTRAEGRVVAAGYFATTVLQIAPLPFAARGSRVCCADNLMVIDSAPGLADALFTVQEVSIVAVVIAASVTLLARWRHATAPQRRALGLVLWSGAATALLVALTLTGSFGEMTLLAGFDWDFAYLAAAASMPFAFLVGLLRSRLRRADAVSELVRRLGEAPRPGKLRGELADALGDPSLMVVYWLPDPACYVDAAGRSIDLPGDGSGRVATAIELDGRRIAAIVHDASLCDEPELVRTAGAAAALALERERLDAELRARIDDLSASRARVVEASDTARRKIERDLHDGAQQRLASLLLRLQLERRARRTDGDDALLDETARGLAEALAELRALATGILPPLLADGGLEPAVRELAHASPVPTDVDAILASRLPQAVEVAAYFIVAESLANVVKHAHASRATVRIAQVDHRAIIEVHDDGVGGADPQRGSGLRGLQDRAGAVKGEITVESGSRQGTLVRAELPCAP